MLRRKFRLASPEASKGSKQVMNLLAIQRSGVPKHSLLLIQSGEPDREQRAQGKEAPSCYRRPQHKKHLAKFVVRQFLVGPQIHSTEVRMIKKKM